jgi:hypothetical protein
VTSTTEERAHGIAGRAFNISQVNEIRVRRSKGESIAQLAAAYSVSVEVVSRMCRGKSYREFPGPITRQEDRNDGNVFPGTRNNCRRVAPHCISEEKRDEIMRDYRKLDGPVWKFCDKHGISNTALNNIISDYESLEFVAMVKREAKRSRDLISPEKVRELLSPGGRFYKVSQ